MRLHMLCTATPKGGCTSHDAPKFVQGRLYTCHDGDDGWVQTEKWLVQCTFGESGIQILDDAPELSRVIEAISIQVEVFQQMFLLGMPRVTIAIR